MTLTQIIGACQDNTKRADKGSVIQTGIDLALQRISALHPFRCLTLTAPLDVASGAVSVTIPSTVVRMIKAYWILNTNSWAIEVRPREYVLERYPNIDATLSSSYPTMAYLEGNILYLYPIPNADGVIKVTYQYLPTLVEGTDTLPVALLDEAIIAYATSWTFKSVQLWQDAAMWEQLFGAAIQTAILADKDQSIIEFKKDLSGGVSSSPDALHDPFANDIYS